jgi:hypothetical protein
VSRRVYLLGLGLALVALGLVVIEGALGPPPGVTKENARRVRKGMTFGEVDAILGGHAHPADQLSPHEHYIWVSRGGCVWVDFDARTGRVTDVLYCGPTHHDAKRNLEMLGEPPLSGPLARLRAWLGW